MQYQIESDIEIPPRKGGGNSNRVYPWPDMSEGQSFFVPCNPQDRKNLASSAGMAARKLGIRPVTRFLTENSETGVRFWHGGAIPKNPEPSYEGGDDVPFN